MPHQSLDALDLLVASALLVTNVVLSLGWGLGIGRQVFIAAVRMVVQLLLLGLVLKQIFALDSAGPVIALAAVMTLVAGWSAVGRVQGRYSGIYLDVTVSVWASSWLVTAVVVFAIVQPVPWYAPSIAIPLLGMVLGNSLTGISLGTDRFLSEMAIRRDEVELRLALGATRWEASRQIVQTAIKAAMIPILNTMSVAGIVSIPGMMTGQLLAGASPMVATKYQIMIMFVIAAAIALGASSAIAIAYSRVTNNDHQLMLPRG